MARAVVQIEGLKKTQRALKEVGHVDDMTWVHQRVGLLVVEAARRRIHSVTGSLSKRMKASRITKGAQVYNSLVYAAVQEYGGSVWWKPKSGRSSVVKYGAGYFATIRAHRIQVKKPVGYTAQQSYYIYPAIREKMETIQLIYREEQDRLNAKYGLK
jgi:hypothetical protein